MIKEYIEIMRRIPAFGRRIIKESYRSFKIYLPKDYNFIWEYLSGNGIKADILLILPEGMLIDKIILRGHKIIKEGDRFKIYLNRKYERIWREIISRGDKIDAIIIIP